MFAHLYRYGICSLVIANWYAGWKTWEKIQTLTMTQDTFARNTRTQLKQMFDALRELMTVPEPSKRPTGFVYPT